MQKNNILCRVIFIFVLLILMSHTRLYPTQAMKQHVLIPSRDKVVWAAGVLGPSPFDWNPFFWSEAWGSSFMYQPLFDYNYELGELIGILGESMEWIDDTTLCITLRDEAKWSDGVPITATDVIYSYDLLSLARLPTFFSRVNLMEYVNDKSILIHLNPMFPFSRIVWDGFIGSNKIAPKHVWEDIADWCKTEYGDLGGWELMNFHNNWLEPGFDESWKVSSGPYQPYF
ncbi:MAG: ABC transporter substrate-binding protein, partial [Candidatus Hodarchaeota archaeon]